jgi:hypothetical protein
MKIETYEITTLLFTNSSYLQKYEIEMALEALSLFCRYIWLVLPSPLSPPNIRKKTLYQS